MPPLDELKEQMANLPDGAPFLCIWLNPEEQMFRSFSTLANESEIARFLARFTYVADMLDRIGDAWLEYVQSEGMPDIVSDSGSENN